MNLRSLWNDLDDDVEEARGQPGFILGSAFQNADILEGVAGCLVLHSRTTVLPV